MIAPLNPSIRVTLIVYSYPHLYMTQGSDFCAIKVDVYGACAFSGANPAIWGKSTRKRHSEPNLPRFRNARVRLRSSRVVQVVDQGAELLPLPVRERLAPHEVRQERGE